MDRDITGGVRDITNYRHPKGVSSVSYAQLLASFTLNEKPRDWYVVHDGVLGGGLEGDSNTHATATTPKKRQCKRRVQLRPRSTRQGWIDGAHLHREPSNANGDGSYGDGDDDDAVKTSLFGVAGRGGRGVHCEGLSRAGNIRKVKFDSKKRSMITAFRSTACAAPLRLLHRSSTGLRRRH